MSFGEAVSTCFSKFADFTGRATRPEFWWFALFNFAVQFLLVIVSTGTAATRTSGEVPTGLVIALLVSLALLLPYLAVAVRRLHDTGRSGGFLFIVLLPLIGTVVLFFVLASPGDSGPNRYGPSPTG